MKTRTYQINEVARLAAVSVRTLHHYDAIGLLVPSNRSAAGYRLYTDRDLLRLQQILIGRALGLALEDIRRMLDEPTLDRRALLRRQRDELQQRMKATAAMIRSIDAALALDADLTGSIHVDMKTIFDGFDPNQYEQEARERWGHTDAYRESRRRTRSYSASDWQRFQEENASILNAAAAALAARVSPDDPLALDIAERARLLIDRWFYPCSRAMHVKLADLWEADERFSRSIDRTAIGLTPFLAAAVRANAARSKV